MGSVGVPAQEEVCMGSSFCPDALSAAIDHPGLLASTLTPDGVDKPVKPDAQSGCGPLGTLHWYALTACQVRTHADWGWG